MSDDGLRASVEKMRKEGVADAAIRAFEHYYHQLEAGETGLMPEESIEPVTDLPSLEDLPDDRDAQHEALQHAVVIRLNGGLGTSMGLSKAKSLLEAKDGLSFLDVIAAQVRAVPNSPTGRIMPPRPGRMVMVDSNAAAGSAV